VSKLTDFQLENWRLQRELDYRDDERKRAREALLRARIAELEAAAERTPLGYITAYRTPEGVWSIEFDGAPFATSEEARRSCSSRRRWTAMPDRDLIGERQRFACLLVAMNTELVDFLGFWR
jgi:hypothetical protein